MKIKLPLFIIILFLSSAVNAQMSDRISFGVKTGLNYANYYGPDYFGTYSRVGWMFGGSFRFELMDNLKLQSEVYYTTKGSAVDVRNEELLFTFTEILNYVEFPFLVQYFINLGESVPAKPFILAGPSFSVLVGSKLKSEVSNFTDEVELDDISAFDTGIIFGTGIYFQRNKKGLYLELRYNLGLLKVYDESRDRNIKNGVFALTLGYVI